MLVGENLGDCVGMCVYDIVYVFGDSVFPFLVVKVISHVYPMGTSSVPIIIESVAINPIYVSVIRECERAKEERIHYRYIAC